MSANPIGSSVSGSEWAWEWSGVAWRVEWIYSAMSADPIGSSVSGSEWAWEWSGVAWRVESGEWRVETGRVQWGQWSGVGLRKNSQCVHIFIIHKSQSYSRTR